MYSKSILAIDSPQIMRDWLKSNQLDPQSVSACSKKKANFHCATHDYSYTATIGLLHKSATGCIVCLGRLTVGSNDFATRDELGVARWSRSNANSAHLTLQGSKKLVSFDCETCGKSYEESPYEHQRRPTPCPHCRGDVLEAGVNDVRTRLEGIVGEIIEPQTPESMVASRGLAVKFLCLKSGHRVSEKFSVLSARGKPYNACCKALAKTILLKDTYPELKIFWSPANTESFDGALLNDERTFIWSINFEIMRYCTPQQFIRSSKKPHLKDALLVLPGVNDFATVRPALAVESISTSPATIHWRSTKLEDWQCSKCGSEYAMTPRDRAVRGRGCPVCASRIVKPRVNDFLTLRPELEKEWAPINTIDPHTLALSSGKVVTWLCQTHGAYDRSVKERALIGSGCRICSHAGWSKEEKEVVEFIKSFYEGPLVENSRKVLGNGCELDVYMPELRKAIEYNGAYWHNEDTNPGITARDATKAARAQELAIALFVIDSRTWKDPIGTIREDLKRWIIGEQK